MARGDISLNPKEYITEQVLEGNLTIKQAAEMLQLSEQQVKRLKKGMKEEGVAALAHKNRGRTPKHAISKDIRDMVCLLATGICKGASANHMAELLTENHGIKISAKSVIRILRSAGIIPEPKKQRRHRKARERAPQEGLLVQIDASPCNWLEGRCPELSLHGAIDDATGKILGLYFRPEEDLRGYFEVLMQVVQRNGVPRCVYSDRHTIFVSPNKDKLTIEEELEGKTVNLTQFGTALNELGISHIQARSPEAKGRIERLPNAVTNLPQTIHGFASRCVNQTQTLYPTTSAAMQTGTWTPLQPLIRGNTGAVNTAPIT
ncbi:MAG: ISNCY family transposase [Candidatus Fermentithermobacillus carboniphilus]|uniref:ISNCY family transposase n=1 Tax=Candidatus Fermentithermobacillus carboniphilus TaxID=3085328 RepID=A0AAT9LAW1_9FIRM|nr:MAG: ISNCY family transposase [Candidatus Fermentithermobacillus carboniphilus]